MKTALYRHYDDKGRLLYVGISLSAVGRLAQHIEGASWARDIARVSIEWLDTRESALDAERRAIINERPLHNVVHNRRRTARAAQRRDAVIVSLADRTFDVINAAAPLGITKGQIERGLRADGLRFSGAALSTAMMLLMRDQKIEPAADGYRVAWRKNRRRAA